MNDIQDLARNEDAPTKARCGCASGECLPVCEVVQTHPQLLGLVRSALPQPREIEELAEFFKAFGDPTRLRLLLALAESELCVCDLAELLGVSQSAVSHQLRFLRATRIVRFRREGKMAIYSLDDEHVRRLLAIGLEHASE
jgi:ArsR family transcriptional regulator